jgi:putative flippase GtrA
MVLANSINNIFNGKLKHLSRFSIVGVLNTLVDFMIFTTFHGLFGLNYILSQVAGYSFGIANSFIFNKKWTFDETKGNKKVFYELFRFVLVNLISLMITVGAMKLLVNNINLNVYLSKIIVTLMAQITNFVFYRFWVFG